MSTTTLLHSLRDALQPYSGQRVYLDRLYGNHGDDLIVRGSEVACERADCKLVSNPTQAQAIFVVGGAGLSSVWGCSYGAMNRYYEGELGKKPLVIFPSTLSFEGADLSQGLNGRQGPTVLFAREQPSLQRTLAVEWAPHVQIGIDNDAAFQLEGTPWLDSLRKRLRSKHLLIVERRDEESLGGGPDAAVPAPAMLKRLVPMGVKRRIKVVSHRRSRTGTPFYNWAVTEAERSLNLPIGSLPVVPIDISLKSIVSPAQFLQLITDAAGIVSTRLHVAILGALLGKPTIVVGGDPKYAKIRGIYDQSMTDIPCVKYFDNPLDARA